MVGGVTKGTINESKECVQKVIAIINCLSPIIVLHY